MRMAAHSCLTIMKSLGCALTTVAIAAVKASATEEVSDSSEADLRFPLNPFHPNPCSPEELRQSFFHFFPPPPPPPLLLSDIISFKDSHQGSPQNVEKSVYEPLKKPRKPWWR